MASPEGIGVKFSEAIEFLRRRLAIGAEEWLQILAEEGDVSTAIADDVVRSVTEEMAATILDIMESGGTYADFQRNYDEIVQQHGWTYKGNSGWHSRLVYRLNVGMAQSAGRWEQAQRLQRTTGFKIYGRYSTVGDHRVRPTHLAWQGIILPLDHPFWQTHWTPNGFNCRCHVEIVTDIDIRRYGWSVTPDDDPRLSIPPDPGWAFNPGVAGMRLRQVEAAAAD